MQISKGISCGLVLFEKSLDGEVRNIQILRLGQRGSITTWVLEVQGKEKMNKDVENGGTNSLT